MILRKLYYINFGLFAVVILTFVLLMNQNHTIPGKPDTDAIKRQLTEAVPKGVGDEETQSYPNLGKRNMFGPLYPKPTPVPTPLPTPKPAVPIEKITASWRLSGTAAGTAQFEDAKTNEEWEMRVGETRSTQWNTESFDVKLDSVNDEGSVVISYQPANGPPLSRSLTVGGEDTGSTPPPGGSN